MIREQSIYVEDGNGRYKICYSDDFEYVDPIKYFEAIFVKTTLTMMRDLVVTKMPSLPSDTRENVIIKQALNDWKKTEAELRQTEIPPNLFQLLNSTSKKHQVKLLRGLAIKPKQLRAFILKAWTDYGFSYSQYTGEHQQTWLDMNKMPALVEVIDGKVNKIGPTSLSDGQLKQAVDHRKRTIAKFLDKDDTWHCFFITYDSLKGKEGWKDGQPHYHYISDKFAISRMEAVKRVKSLKYQLGNLPHIDLIENDTKV